MNGSKRVALDPELLDVVSGGAFGYDPDGNGTYTMNCQYSGQVFYGVQLNSIIEIAKYGAYFEDNAEDEQKIVAWALQQGYIHA